jgi:hypothetical protein
MEKGNIPNNYIDKQLLFCLYQSMLILFSLLYLFFFLAPGVSPVHAYLDPGNGSYIIQLFFGGVLGLIISTKLFWKSIHTFFSNIFRKKPIPKKED